MLLKHSLVAVCVLLVAAAGDIGVFAKTSARTKRSNQINGRDLEVLFKRNYLEGTPMPHALSPVILARSDDEQSVVSKRTSRRSQVEKRQAGVTPVPHAIPPTEPLIREPEKAKRTSRRSEASSGSVMKRGDQGTPIPHAIPPTKPLTREQGTGKRTSRRSKAAHGQIMKRRDQGSPVPHALPPTAILIRSEGEFSIDPAAIAGLPVAKRTSRHRTSRNSHVVKRAAQGPVLDIANPPHPITRSMQPAQPTVTPGLNLSKRSYVPEEDARLAPRDEDNDCAPTIVNAAAPLVRNAKDEPTTVTPGIDPAVQTVTATSVQGLKKRSASEGSDIDRQRRGFVFPPERIDFDDMGPPISFGDAVGTTTAATSHRSTATAFRLNVKGAKVEIGQVVEPLTRRGFVFPPERKDFEDMGPPQTYVNPVVDRTAPVQTATPSSLGINGAKVKQNASRTRHTGTKKHSGTRSRFHGTPTDIPSPELGNAVPALIRGDSGTPNRRMLPPMRNDFDDNGPPMVQTEIFDKSGVVHTATRKVPAAEATDTDDAIDYDLLSESAAPMIADFSDPAQDVKPRDVEVADSAGPLARDFGGLSWTMSEDDQPLQRESLNTANAVITPIAGLAQSCSKDAPTVFVDPASALDMSRAGAAFELSVSLAAIAVILVSLASALRKALAYDSKRSGNLKLARWSWSNCVVVAAMVARGCQFAALGMMSVHSAWSIKVLEFGISKDVNIIIGWFILYAISCWISTSTSISTKLASSSYGRILLYSAVCCIVYVGTFAALPMLISLMTAFTCRYDSTFMFPAFQASDCVACWTPQHWFISSLAALSFLFTLPLVICTSTVPQEIDAHVDIKSKHWFTVVSSSATVAVALSSAWLTFSPTMQSAIVMLVCGGLTIAIRAFKTVNVSWASVIAMASNMIGVVGGAVGLLSRNFKADERLWWILFAAGFVAVVTSVLISPKLKTPLFDPSPKPKSSRWFTFEIETADQTWPSMRTRIKLAVNNTPHPPHLRPTPPPPFNRGTSLLSPLFSSALPNRTRAVIEENVVSWVSRKELLEDDALAIVAAIERHDPLLGIIFDRVGEGDALRDALIAAVRFGMFGATSASKSTLDKKAQASANVDDKKVNTSKDVEKITEGGDAKVPALLGREESHSQVIGAEDLI